MTESIRVSQNILETSSLVRKVREAVPIREYVGDLLLDKLDYNRCLHPELTTMVLKKKPREEPAIIPEENDMSAVASEG